MISSKMKRSPLFYVGDKFKLMSQLKPLFPRSIKNFFEPFVGGGTVFLNINAEKHYLNDIDDNLMRLHKTLFSYAKKREVFFSEVERIIHEFNLSRSYKEDIVPDKLKKAWNKTYFAKFNKPGYVKLREWFNRSGGKDPVVMYILLIYGFNRMLRFNKSGRFNLPVGNVDFNKNVIHSLKEYFDVVAGKNIKFSSLDFRNFLGAKFNKNDFVYLDPPYLITSSEYNKFWNEKNETDLLKQADSLEKRKIRFALSNVVKYNGKENKILSNWMRKYNVHPIRSNYISYNNNSIKQITEVLVTNYASDK